MSLDDTIALVDVNELKEYLQIAEDTAATNPFLETLINAASKRIENYCRCKFIRVTTAIDEIWDGDGEGEYHTKHSPLVATITTLNYWNGKAWAAMTGETHDQNNDDGIIYFTDGNKFWKGSRNWKISYTYGLSRANIPADLKQACCELIAQKKKLFEDGLHGVSGKSFGDQSISFSFNMTKDIKQTLDKYTRY